MRRLILCLLTIFCVSQAHAANYSPVLDGLTVNGTTTLNGPVNGLVADPFFAAPPDIGNITPAQGFFTNLFFNGTLTATGTVTGIGITNLFASPPTIGSGVPGVGFFGNLTSNGAFIANGTIAGPGFNTLFSSPPPIGDLFPGNGTFNTLTSKVGFISTGTLSGSGFTNLFASPPDIGTTTPGNGTFSSLTSSGLTVHGGANVSGAVVGATGAFGSVTGTTNSPGQTAQVSFQNWAGFWIDPCWYGPGCVTNGTGDNQPAFQAAINAQPSGSYVTLHVHGPGTYNFASSVVNNGRFVQIDWDAGAIATGPATNVYRVDRTMGALHQVWSDTSGLANFNTANTIPSNNGMIEKWSIVADNNIEGEYIQRNMVNKNQYNTAVGDSFLQVNLSNYIAGVSDGTPIFNEWDLDYCPQIGDANYFTNGNQNQRTTCHEGEIDITNYAPSFGFISEPGNAWGVRGRFFASQSGFNRLGGDVLWNLGMGIDAGSGGHGPDGPNAQCPFYPCVYSSFSASAVTSGFEININGTPVAIGGAGAAADVVNAINGAAIANVIAGVNAIGTLDTRLWIANNLPNGTGSLTLSDAVGTPLEQLKITAGTYTGDSLRTGKWVMAQSLSAGANLVLTAGNSIIVTLSGNPSSPQTLLVPGGGLTGASVIAAWVNSFAIPGFTAAAGNGGNAVDFLYIDPLNGSNQNFSMVNGTGTPLTTLGIASGVQLYKNLPPVALATSYSWNTFDSPGIGNPCLTLPCSMVITPTNFVGTPQTPVTVTVSSSGSNTTAGWAAAINAASIPGIIAGFRGGTGFVWLFIQNTTGQGFTLADGTGTPLEVLRMIPGKYQAGGYVIGAMSAYNAAPNSTAHNGVSFFAGGNGNTGMNAAYLPRNPFAASYSYYDGEDLSLAHFTTGRAYIAAPSQTFAFTDGLQLSDCGIFLCTNASPITTDNSLKLATTQMVQAAITAQIEANASATVPLGNGSDGAFVCSSGNPFFTHDMQSTNVTITGNCKVNTNNFKWFATGIGDMSAAGNRAVYCTSVTIPAAPTGTTGQTPGGSPATVFNPTLPVVVFTANPSTGYGGNSSTGSGSAASVVSNSSFYSNGGNGGAGGAGGGATGGAGSAGAANLHSANVVPQSSPYTDFVTSNRNTAIDMIRPGYVGGGGGGGDGDGVNAGGPGGASAAPGCTIELSWNIINRGSGTAVGAISSVPSNSGAGGASPGGNANGGGGGGGSGAGPIYIYVNTLTGTSATNMIDSSGGLGGNGGAGTGSGLGGVAGTGGNSGYIQILQSNVAPFFSPWNQVGSAPIAPSGTTGGIGGAGAVLQQSL